MGRKIYKMWEKKRGTNEKKSEDKEKDNAKIEVKKVK
jgi:hypothetical protein